MKEKITLSINTDLLEKITKRAKRFNISRNALISFILSDYSIHITSNHSKLFAKTKYGEPILLSENQK